MKVDWTPAILQQKSNDRSPQSVLDVPVQVSYAFRMARKRTAKPTTLEERVELRMSVRDRSTFQEAAQRQGISLSHWLRLAAWRIINEHEGKVVLVDLDK
jgi:hypothetical protein